MGIWALRANRWRGVYGYPFKRTHPQRKMFSFGQSPTRGRGLPELFGTNCFPSWGEGEGGKENTATAPAVLKMQQLRGAFKNYLADFVRWGGWVPPNSAKEFGPILTLFYEKNIIFSPFREKISRKSLADFPLRGRAGVYPPFPLIFLEKW